MMRILDFFKRTNRSDASIDSSSWAEEEGGNDATGEIIVDPQPEIAGPVLSETPSTPTTLAPTDSGASDSYWSLHLQRSASADSKGHSYHQYGLGSPPKGPRAVSDKKAIKAIRNDGMKRFLKNEKTRPAIVFLYGKGFMVNKPKERRKEMVRRMISYKHQSRTSSDHDERQPLDRLLQVVSAEGDVDTFVENQELYQNVCWTYEAYLQQENAEGFLPASDANLFIRHQNDGNCFLQAPCVLAAYWLQKHGHTNTAPVDISKFIRHSFTDKQLMKYVIQDDGGNSIDVLKTIIMKVLKDDSGDVITYSSSGLKGNSEIIFDLLSKHGPGLVSSFHVDSKFANAKMEGGGGYVQFHKRHTNRGIKHIHISLDDEHLENHELGLSVDDISGKNEDASKVSHHDTHAMILIAARRDKKKTVWLLLQNSWKEMPLVEVSLDYFIACKGWLTFPCEEVVLENDIQLNEKNWCAVNTAKTAECNNVDRAESSSGGCFIIPVYDR